jgi:hypothetical protein
VKEGRQRVGLGKGERDEGRLIGGPYMSTICSQPSVPKPNKTREGFAPSQPNRKQDHPNPKTRMGLNTLVKSRLEPCYIDVLLRCFNHFVT